jgi:hypothetical protein
LILFQTHHINVPSKQQHWLLTGSTLDAATYPRRVARTGVLQGEAANANVSPARYACTPNSITLSCKIVAFKYNTERTKSKNKNIDLLDGKLAATERGSKLSKNEGSVNSIICKK